MRLLTVFLFFCFLATSQELSNPKTYIVLQNIGEIEFREYKPALFASYIHNNKIIDRNSSFRVLANYIFGSNKTGEKIAMTSPVIIRLSNDNEMLFRMPEKYTETNVPKPNDKKLKFIQTDYIKKATIGYSGYSNSKKEKNKIEELKNILKENNIKHNNQFELLVYDPPYKFFNRRNEIAVTLPR